MNERERFEAWANRFFAPVLIKRHADGENAGKYFGFCVEEAWYAWQAAKAEAAERERALEMELTAVRDEWNRMVKASGSPTHGTAIGHVAALVAEVERLREKGGDG